MTLDQLIQQARQAIAIGDLATAERYTREARAIRNAQPPPADPVVAKVANRALQALDAGDNDSAGYLIDRIKGIQGGDVTVNLTVLKKAAAMFTDKPVSVEVRSIDGALSELDGETITLDPALFEDKKHLLESEFLTQLGHILLGHKNYTRQERTVWKSLAWRSETARRALVLDGQNVIQAKAWAQSQKHLLRNRLVGLYGADSLFKACTEN